MSSRIPVLIAGIGGAGLGTEILKCLSLVADRYEIFGCDVSKLAFGHYTDGFSQTFVVDERRYVDSVLDVCRKEGIAAIIPGGEQPSSILAAARATLDHAGVRLAANAPEVVASFSDKLRTFDILRKLGIPVPKTIQARVPEDLDSLTYPCVIKPATGSGGSVLVSLAADKQEAWLFASHLLTLGRRVVAQEYVRVDEGEFTIGVLSLPNRSVVGSIVLQRQFPSKLSMASNSSLGLISSGYSQGLIDHFPELRGQAARIAQAAGSRGPFNIQGRVRNGTLLPFEINPRFSASTYLRALAGFNEVDLFLRQLMLGEVPAKCPEIRPGYYLRSLREVYVPKTALKS